uniref:Si:dkey-181m9.8 n=1 Tax=Oryzias latipes TaxID=8090 RepID=A0A3P9HMU6_ORYLA
MQKVRPKAELRILTECQYSHPVETLLDLQEARSRFPDLSLYADYYCFPNKETKKLVFLAGTLPILYEGSTYNIPVCVWLHVTHPESCPRCYVCPSASMVINPSCPCINASGNISLDGLTKWTRGVSSLSELLAEMIQVFQRDTPIYARCPVQAPSFADVHLSAVKAPASANVHLSSVRAPSTTAPLPAGVHLSAVQTPSSPVVHLSPVEAPPPARKHQSPGQALPPLSSIQNISSRSSPLNIQLPNPSSHLSGHKASGWDQSSQVGVRSSYVEELQGIDFSAPPLSSNVSTNPFLGSASSGDTLVDPLSSTMAALILEEGSSRNHQDDFTAPKIKFEGAQDSPTAGSGADFSKLAARLPADQAAVFLALMTLQGQSFSPADALEAVQLNKDFSSALKFLTHTCPICHEQVSFSKIVTMTHCSCFLCQMCFTAFFSVAIKERSVDQLVCPQCGKPEVRAQGGLEDATEYFNLLDTQIRHYLPRDIHELFQRKLRDRTLREMPDFCWCAHCSFGILHEAERLRMDCPSCKKSTCSRCRSPWAPQHQRLSCEQFKAWQEQNQLDHHGSTPISNSIECPGCRSVFSLARGGCLHFTCTQCQHQFCGGCARTFTAGSACGFSAECGSKGLHAHHPRDCLFHLRDWSVSRLLLLLQHYRISPAWIKPASGSSSDGSQTAVCSVLELRDDGSKREEPCGRPTPQGFQGYCQLHYKERLVELINRFHCDPAVLFSPAEMVAELQRWRIAVPSMRPDEPEPLYAHRLRLMLTNHIPLRY